MSGGMPLATVAVLSLVMAGVTQACQSAGVCCCGGCGGGGRGYFRARAAKTLAIGKKNEETVEGLHLWHDNEKLDNLTYTQVTNPNFLFSRCCAERQLPRGCASKCSHQAYTANALRAMYLHLDACPVNAAAELHFCAAQGRDHRACCTRLGVGRTAAGEKCLALCDQRPNQFTQLDFSYLPCQEKFEEMKACFWEGVRRAAKGGPCTGRMFLSPAWWNVRQRQDIRPLYRRILTNRRLDIAHKTAVRSIFGFLLFSTSYLVVNGFIYYKYVRPLRQEERERLEQELIEADKAGFSINKQAI